MNSSRSSTPSIWGSIEGAYISISRYALENPGGLSWFPLWYGGIPYQNSYPPLLHLLVAAFAWVTGFSVALSYHTITALMYCLGPVTLFWMSWRLSGSRSASLGAALLYSLFSPSAILMPSVLEDLGTSLGPRRLQALVYWGEGPHVTAMALFAGGDCRPCRRAEKAKSGTCLCRGDLRWRPSY